MNQNDLAAAMGVERSVVSRAINEKRKIPVEELIKFGKVLGVRPEWLLTGDTPMVVEPKSLPGEPRSTLNVVSYIGAGAEVIPVDDGDNIAQIDLDFPIPPGSVAAIVRGDSMYPIFEDGDLVAYGGEPLPPEKAVGSTCVVQVADGRMLIKRVRRGSQPGLYTLTSSNAPDIEDVPLDWARAFVLRLSRDFWRKGRK